MGRKIHDAPKPSDNFTKEELQNAMNRESVENMMERASKAIVYEDDIYSAKESFEAILAIEADGSAAFAAAQRIAEEAIAKIIHPVILGAEVRRLGLLGRGMSGK